MALPVSRVLRVTVESQEGQTLKSGCLDAGYPVPGKIRQAQFVLPKGTKWQGMKLRAEIEVKGMRYPVRWACSQSLNADGSLTLRPNLQREISSMTREDMTASTASATSATRWLSGR